MDVLTAGTTMLDRVSSYLTGEPPTLPEIMGCVCELYRVDPDEIGLPFARIARGVFCYVAHRFAGVPNREISQYAAMDFPPMMRAAADIKRRMRVDPLLRDDLDILALRIVDRVMVRRVLARRPS